MIASLLTRPGPAQQHASLLSIRAVSMAMAGLLLASLAAGLPPFKCVNDLDCELTGSCDAGRCACFPGWSGPTCGTLDLLPARREGAWPAQRAEPPEYWGDGATPASWGAHINKADDGRYHIIAAAGCYIPARVRFYSLSPSFS